MNHYIKVSQVIQDRLMNHTFQINVKRMSQDCK